VSSSEAAVPTWRKGSRCQANSTCVEIAGLAGGEVAVRGTEDPGPTLIFGPTAWRMFIQEVKAGHHDPA